MDILLVVEYGERLSGLRMIYDIDKASPTSVEAFAAFAAEYF